MRKYIISFTSVILTNFLSHCYIYGTFNLTELSKGEKAAQIGLLAFSLFVTTAVIELIQDNKK